MGERILKLHGIDISEKVRNRSARNPSKEFPWQVIDKKNASSHPLWFKSFEDLRSFYSSKEFLWKDNADNLRIIKTDDSGKEVERYSFEI